jgi:hypothetical protein
LLYPSSRQGLLFQCRLAESSVQLGLDKHQVEESGHAMLHMAPRVKTIILFLVLKEVSLQGYLKPTFSPIDGF